MATESIYNSIWEWKKYSKKQIIWTDSIFFLHDKKPA